MYVYVLFVLCCHIFSEQHNIRRPLSDITFLNLFNFQTQPNLSFLPHEDKIRAKKKKPDLAGIRNKLGFFRGKTAAAKNVLYFTIGGFVIIIKYGFFYTQVAKIITQIFYPYMLVILASFCSAIIILIFKPYLPSVFNANCSVHQVIELDVSEWLNLFGLFFIILTGPYKIQIC